MLLFFDPGSSDLVLLNKICFEGTGFVMFLEVQLACALLGVQSSSPVVLGWSKGLKL